MIPSGTPVNLPLPSPQCDHRTGESTQMSATSAGKAVAGGTTGQAKCARKPQQLVIFGSLPVMRQWASHCGLYPALRVNPPLKTGLQFRQLGRPSMTHTPCHGYVNGCHCPECQERITLITEHQAAGRNPFTRNGKLKPLPAKPVAAQPWDLAA